MKRWWLASVLPVSILAIGLVPAFRRQLHAQTPGAATGDTPSLSKATSVTRPSEAPAAALAGLDLTKVSYDDTGVSAPAANKRTAHLFIDANLQKTAKALMAFHHLPEAAVVLMDVATGHVITYASHVEHGPARDLCAEATAPAASVFKVVTGAALVELAGAHADQRECYSGGEQRILESDLEPNPARDKWCVTLGGAMGRSINTVFARTALRSLQPAKLDEFARGAGFGQPLPFDVPVQASAINIPGDNVGFARTAAGFWNTTLSPLHAATISAAVARGGEMLRPAIVAEVKDGNQVAYQAKEAQVLRRVMKQETADAVTVMMDHTVNEGTSYRAFHDIKRKPFLPGIPVAGKTGTLTDAQTQRYYTWFTGFAPSHPQPNLHQVAVSVLVVNEATWRVKANTIAREMLRAYFAAANAPMVTAPQLRPTTRDASKEAKAHGGSAATVKAARP